MYYNPINERAILVFGAEQYRSSGGFLIFVLYLFVCNRIRYDDNERELAAVNMVKLRTNLSRQNTRKCMMYVVISSGYIKSPHSSLKQ